MALKLNVTCVLSWAFNLVALAANPLLMTSYLVVLCSFESYFAGDQLTSDGLWAGSDGLPPRCDGPHPKCDGLQPTDVFYLGP